MEAIPVWVLATKSPVPKGPCAWVPKYSEKKQGRWDMFWIKSSLWDHQEQAILCPLYQNKTWKRGKILDDTCEAGVTHVFEDLRVLFASKVYLYVWTPLIMIMNHAGHVPCIAEVPRICNLFGKSQKNLQIDLLLCLFGYSITMKTALEPYRKHIKNTVEQVKFCQHQFYKGDHLSFPLSLPLRYSYIISASLTWLWLGKG